MSIIIENVDGCLASMDAEIARIIQESDHAIAETCDLVQDEAQMHCPVGTPESTGKKDYEGGTLRDSIDYEHELGSCEGRVGSGEEAPYGPYVEHGTYKMRARPFMFPAGLLGEQYLKRRIKGIGK